MHINIFAVFGCVKSGCRHSVLCTPSQPNDCCKFIEINFHIHEYVYVGSSSCCVVCSCHYFFFYYFIFFFLFSYFFIVLTRQIRACLEGNLRIHITSSRAWCVRTDVVHRWLCREQQPAETGHFDGKVFFGLHYYDIGSSCACKHPLQLSNHTQFVWIWIWGKLALCAIVAELAFGCCWFCMSFGFRLMNECYIHKGPNQRH